MAKRGSRARQAPRRKPIEQYEHADKERINNPPVGLVTPETDPAAGKKQYRYDPHLDPALQFDSGGGTGQAAEIERIIDAGLAGQESGVRGQETEDETAQLRAELAQTQQALAAARAALTELKKRRQPYLAWAGKAERTTFEVPTVSLHVHERIEPRTIIEAVRKQNGRERQLGLFERPGENRPLREAIDFYRYPHGWSNRLIAGDSLLVMNSLLEKEGMAGKVQMVYIDPPYGIRYGSNFQPFVNKRDVKDRSDDDLTSEPEMLRAFRDTWELGIHSYLTYLRDRLLLAKELLHESGSCFVQISEENVQLVRNVMDEVFGMRNLVAQIAFRKKLMPLGAKTLEGMNDYLCWYGKDKPALEKRYRQLYVRTTPDPNGRWTGVREAEGTLRRLTKAEREDFAHISEDCELFGTVSQWAPSFSPANVYEFEFEGRTYKPTPGQCWITSKEKMATLGRIQRLFVEGEFPRYVAYHSDFPYRKVTHPWNDTAPAQDKTYAVQTSEGVIERCILMTTEAGDLVLDPTCGSGTTAYVAEQWGRRWITTDTSRVAIALAKQRLTTALFDYYKLAHEEHGVSGGFICKTVPHVTLKSIANNPEIREGMTRAQIDAAIAKYAEQETLYDQPEIDKSKARVTGPFTVEAVPAPVVRSVSDSPHPGPLPEGEEDGAGETPTLRLGPAIARDGETLRQAQWRDELLKTGARGQSGQMLAFTRIEPLAGCAYLHAEGESKADGGFGRATWKAGERVVVSFGPEHAPLEQRQVELAWQEARELEPRPKLLLFAAFEFDPEAAKDIDALDPAKARMVLLKAKMNGDLFTEDLKKKRASNESFWLIGQPEVAVRRAKGTGDRVQGGRRPHPGPLPEGEGEGKERMWQVEVLGFDYWNPKTGNVESGDTRRIAMWMLDPDYDGRSLYPRQVFFPMAGPKDGWARLAANLKAEIDPERIEAYRGVVSLPFEQTGKRQKIAVKIIDDRGIESLVVRDLGAEE